MRYTDKGERVVKMDDMSNVYTDLIKKSNMTGEVKDMCMKIIMRINRLMTFLVSSDADMGSIELMVVHKEIELCNSALRRLAKAL